MQTQLSPQLLATEAGQEADTILRACVHCGFCTATCPTYQVTSNELDGPRGRIYLLKNLLEGGEVSDHTRHHLDRCLQCQSCETTCPSGVNYHRLLDIGQQQLDEQQPRSWSARLMRRGLRAVMTRRRLFTALLRLGQPLRAFLPSLLRHHVPPRRAPLPSRQAETGQRRMILMQGCVQPGLSPQTLEAAGQVLAALGIQADVAGGEACCGAVDYHLRAAAAGAEKARRNLAVWAVALDAGVEAIVITATGCGNFIQDYARLVKDDPEGAALAERVLPRVRDIAEVLADEALETLPLAPAEESVLHLPCTAQHGQALAGPISQVLRRAGYDLPAVQDAHLCCGSAGSYSLLHPTLSQELGQRKCAQLEAAGAGPILTANIGCQTHLGALSERPVTHWVEALARRLVE